jgi:membrane protease YdiL (CAAX protease family)
MIDDALEAADDVLQHRRPREHPDGLRQGAVDDPAVEFLLRRYRCRWWSVGMAVALFCVFGIPMKALLIANHYFDLGEAPSYWAIFDKDWNVSFWIFMAVGSYAVIPVFEETFYRGYAQGRMEAEFGFAGAVFVAALFVAAHFQYQIGDVLNVWMLVSLFCLAMAMAFARHATGSLLGPILIHALMNVPVAHPFDIVILLVMLSVGLVFRNNVRLLLTQFGVVLGGVRLLEIVPLLIVAAGFAAAMTIAPEIAVVGLGVFFLLSVITQIVLRGAATRRGASSL